MNLSIQNTCKDNKPITEKGQYFLAISFILILIILFGILPQSYAATPAGYGKFFIPGDENVLVNVLENVGAGTQDGPMHSIIAVTAWAEDTIVYYDHWEDGYDFDQNNPSSTADATFVLTKTGDGIRFESNDISIPRPTTTIACADTSATTGSGSTILLTPGSPASGGSACRYDGRDILYSAGGSITVTRASWDEDATPLQSLAWEVFPVRPQLIKYVMPFGEDLSTTRSGGDDSNAASGDYTDFETVYALVQATQDNTVVQIDFDGDGNYDPIDEDGDGSCTDNNDGDNDNTTIELGIGENFLISRNTDGNGGASCMINEGLLRTGTVVLASDTIQMQYVIGDTGTTYEIRGLSAFPRGFWDDEYYAPVDNPSTQTGRPVDIFIFNPHSFDLTIDYETTNSSGQFVIPFRDTANGDSGVLSLREAIGGDLPADSSIYLKGNNVFWGISTIDSEGVISDWGYSLVPGSLLRDENYLGWAPEYDSTAGTNVNASGIFIAPAQDNISLFIDTDNDGSPESTFSLNRLETLYYTDPNDIDLSQAHIYATGPYAIAYGQDPDAGISGNAAGYDVGYTVLPTSNEWFDLALTVDKGVDPVTVGTGIGEITKYTITVDTHEYAIENITVIDTLATGWAFCTTTTTPACAAPVITFADGSTSNAAPSGTTGDLTWGSTEFGGQLDMNTNQTLIIEYYAYTSATHPADSITTSPVQVIGERTVGSPSVTQTFTASDRVFNLYSTSDMTITKTSDVTDTAAPGDTIEYTLLVTNTGSTALTNISVYDALPPGVAYVANSANVEAGVCAASTGTKRVRDQFDTNGSYGGNNGTDNWDGDWTENDNGGASGGDIEVNNNAIRFDTGTDGGEWVQRSWTITDSPATVTVSFDFSDDALDGNDDFFVEYSIDGGGFTTLQALDGGSANQTYTSNITWNPGFSTITLRIRAEDDVENNEFAYFDNVDISYSYSAPASAPTLSDPPSLLQSSAGCALAVGASLELSFDVTVNNPLATGITELTNTASATSAQIPVPVQASVTDPVNNPTSQSATVGDRVWNDTNGNGAVDVGEAGISGVTVVLKDQFGTPLKTTTTDSQGRYSFTGVLPGNGYYVEATSGLSGVIQTNGSNNRTSAFNLTAGQNFNEADLGFQPASGTAIIGDRVWSDADGDGVQDAGEPGLPGVTVRLYTDANGNGAIDGGETFVETTTAANGSYQFSVTANGTEDYIVFIDPAQGALGAYNLTTQDTFFYQDVTDSGSYRTADVGAQQQNPGTTFNITDRIWLDSNGDAQDDSESGIANVTVDLLDASGNVIATTMTAADGTFTFAGVPAGVRYSWRISDQNGVLTNYFGTTSPAQAGVFQMPSTLTGDLDYTAEPTEPHFGYNLNRSIGNTVFNDLNGNGSQESGESGISGVVVKLYNDADGDGVIDSGTDTVQATLTTGANGDYLFSGLTDGNYIVSIESPPAGYTYTGTGGMADSDAGTAGQQNAANITGGVSDLTNDFPYQAGNPRTLSGRVWNDANEDGDDESGAEDGFENVTIELYEDINNDGQVDAGDNRIGTTSTASDGSYSFVGVQGNGSENYIVRITDDNGVLSSTQTTYERTEGTGGNYNGLERISNLNADINDLDFGFAPIVVSMPITLASVDSRQTESGLWVEWTTATETRNAGFHLYGRLQGEKTWRLLTEQLIPSKVIDSLDPQRYYATFPGVVVDELLLEDWDSHGQTEQHGPFAVGRLHGFDAVAHSQRIDWVAIRAENAEDQAQRKTLQRTFSVSLAAATAGQPDALLWVEEPGIQRVSFAALQAAGADFSAVAIADLALTDNGKARPRHVIDANANGVFDAGDSVEFVGAIKETLYSTRNAYRLHINPALVKAANSRTMGPKNAVSEVFADTIKFEQQKAYSFAALGDDPWYDQWLFARGQPASLQRQFDLPGYAGGDATLNLSIWGVTDWPGDDDDHHLIVKVNGQVIADLQFDGSVDASRTMALSEGLIQATGNTLTLEAPGDTGYAYDIQAFDGFSVDYQRQTQAHNGAWQGTIPAAVTAKIRLDGFQGPVVAWKGAQRRVGNAPVYIKGTGAWVAADARAFQTPTVQAEIPIPAAAPTRGAVDYLIISHEAFIDTPAMADLVALQQGRGYSTQVIDVATLYAAYNDFAVSADAIRRYLRAARPSFVLLVGGDSYDYHDYLGLASQSFIPTHYAATDTVVTYAPADNRHVDYNGNGIPQAALGRLPVRTAAELTQLVAKLYSYTPPAHAVFSAGPSDSGREFARVSEGYADQLPNSMAYQEFYADDLSLAVAKPDLTTELNLPGALVSYIGHSSYRIWGLNPSHGILFWADDARKLTNATPHIVTQWGCWNTYFVNPKQDTMANGFLFQNQGAAAVLGATALTDLGMLRGLGNEFFNQYGRRATLGDALRRAQQRYANNNPGAAQALRGFALLGDPAAELR